MNAKCENCNSYDTVTRNQTVGGGLAMFFIGLFGFFVSFVFIITIIFAPIFLLLQVAGLWNIIKGIRNPIYSTYCKSCKCRKILTEEEYYKIKG